ncbi:PREDICTED: uncharacterized protein LOC104596085 [Nelumbo nucifera]|uniref:PAR1 protein n=2 Tax=Nelumbo nucifera TaxID=4432 RepID=A0A822XJE4_NELNU|nr:PREDICTED: uncharacterized protein LOC104596085 [Nelumbo nucifera]DAD18895.1 TPA_asm: hypothetical protein HUJ06_020358 [Nelumbo nucifera]
MDSFYSTTTLAAFTLLLALLLPFPLAFGGITCENLPNEYCAFSVSSAGFRCVLEKYEAGADGVKLGCKSSDVLVENTASWVEIDDCIESCGLKRKSVGISSDSLLEPNFLHKLCSPKCFQFCPNIVDLYFNLAAAEGVYLPKLCQKMRSKFGQVWAPVGAPTYGQPIPGGEV